MKSPTCTEIASSYSLWGEYIDPGNNMTEIEFDQLLIEERVDLIHGIWPIGTEPGCVCEYIEPELKSAAAALGRKGGKSTSAAKRTAARANGAKRCTYLFIHAAQVGDGWTLLDQAGKPVQEWFSYPNRATALEAAEQLWPANSVWHGRRIGSTWRIKTN